MADMGSLMSTNGKRILLVDSDQDMGWLLKNVLHQLGCDLVVTNSWDTTLMELAQGQPDLILLDIPLIGFSITNFLRLLNHSLPAVPVVIIHPSTAGVARKKFKEIGQYAFIEKPFVVDHLVGKIREVLGAQLAESTG